MKIPLVLKAEMDLDSKLFFNAVSNFVDLMDEDSSPNSGHLIYSDGVFKWFDLEFGIFQVETFEEQNARKKIGKNDLLAKAIGFKNGCDRVLDATLGFAQDSRYFLDLDLDVIAFEWNPVVYLMTSSALAKSNYAKKHKIQIKFGEIHHSFEKLKLSEKDSIYFDPMFEEVEKKSALPKKSMQIMRKLKIFQPRSDSFDFELSQILKSIEDLPSEQCPGRIIIKNALKDIREYKDCRTQHSFKGKSIRYDWVESLLRSS